MNLKGATRIARFIARCTRYSTAVNLIYPERGVYSVYAYNPAIGYPGWSAVMQNIIHSIDEGLNFVFDGTGKWVDVEGAVGYSPEEMRAVAEAIKSPPPTSQSRRPD